MRKILFLDLETYGHDFAANLGYILCGSYKWLGEKKVYRAERKSLKPWLTQAENDVAICKELAEAIAQADVVITWNGLDFDYKFLQARMLHHDLGALKIDGHEDLLRTARKRLGMRPRSLEEVGRFLKCRVQKKKIPKEVWLAAGRGDPKAIKEWGERCNLDVLLLEEIYLKLGPLSITHPNVSGKPIDEGYCTFCGRKKLIKQGFKWALRTFRQQYKCGNCHKWQTGKPQKYKE